MYPRIRLRHYVVHVSMVTVMQEVSEQMYTLHERELKRQRSVDVQQRNELAVVIQRWKGSRRFFTGERGAWSSR